MFDAAVIPDSVFANEDVKPHIGGSRLFWAGKRVFDLSVSALLLIPLGLSTLLLLLLNPFFNQGPLFYSQTRMGRDCKPFTAIKFRSMTATAQIDRGPNDPLEKNRITPLGHIMRTSRIDELPQILNVFRGDMSLIGPRPDYFDHAQFFVSTIPGYRQRHCVRPGISGLAQTSLGYIEGSDATRDKVQKDLIYIRRAGFLLDSWIVWTTALTVLRRGGA